VVAGRNDLVPEVTNQLGRIRVSYDPDKREVTISADSEGLESIARICQRIAGQESPAGHWHFSEWFGTVDEGSLDLVLEYVAGSTPAPEEPSEG
jgi:hypothetical protein